MLIETHNTRRRVSRFGGRSNRAQIVVGRHAGVYPVGLFRLNVSPEETERFDSHLVYDKRFPMILGRAED